MKGGIPYFPLDCQLDEKFELIEAEFGLIGFSVVVKLLQRIYNGDGYYCEWSNEVALLFAKKLGLGGSVVSEIVSASIKRGMFSKELYEEYHILTSQGIQKRYLDAVSRRKTVQMKKSYLLLNCDQISKNVDILSENVYRIEENADTFEQRKGKERKEEESKENTTAKPARKQAVKFTPPTLDEIAVYCRGRKNNVDPKRFLDFFTVSEWIDSKGNPVRNWKQKIITWENGARPTAKAEIKEWKELD